MKTSELVWQDTQHQELLKMLAQLKASPEVDFHLLDELDAYVVHHFSLEEKYMELTHYPNTEKHVRLHRNFSNKVHELKQGRHIVEEGFHNENFKRMVVDFLTQWFTEHIMGIDRELEDHVLRSSIK